MLPVTAILQTLAFVGAAGLVLCTLAATVLLLVSGRQLWAQRALAACGLLVSGYVVLLLFVSVTSRPLVLARGESKRFCEIDCHVAYAITSAHAGRESDAADSMLLTVREEFDASSISPRRGDAPMHPGTRRFALVDSSGRRYAPERVRSLDDAPLFAAMRPGEIHRAQLAFRVPRGVPIVGLLVEDDSPVSPLLIGHERSPLHAKTLLSLPLSTTRARAARAPSAQARRG